ncbi:hypothetical protein [Streptomyces goshikiensis]|uniref:hypothetical protein n=1 Tax=Streptomyces goshikiensis TaxID=1942 RepID=UPI0036AEEF46
MSTFESAESPYSDHVVKARRHVERARVGADSPAADHLAAAQVEATLAQAEALRLLATLWAARQQPTGTVTLESRGPVLPD